MTADDNADQPGSDDFADLVVAAADNLDFWNNPWDDEDWNDVC